MRNFCQISEMTAVSGKSVIHIFSPSHTAERTARSDTRLGAACRPGEKNSPWNSQKAAAEMRRAEGRSARTIRSARRAMSLLWVIITTVCRNSVLVRLISPSTSALVLLSRLPVGSGADNFCWFLGSDKEKAYAFLMRMPSSILL